MARAKKSPEDRAEEQEMAKLDAEEKRIQRIVGSAALAKACMDEYQYYARLRTGELIYFRSAKVINKNWVSFDLFPMDDQPENNTIGHKCERGLEVRLSDIVWVADAGH